MARGDDVLDCIGDDDSRPILFLIVGLRSYYAYQQGTTRDTCPIFAEPIMRTWQVPCALLERSHTAKDLAAAYQKAQTEMRAGAVLIAE